MRGTASIASTLIFFACNFSINSGFCAGQIKLTNVVPSLINAISFSVGAFTLKIMSAFQTSSCEPILAPAFANALSSKLALNPASCSIRTSKPSFLICSTVFGVAATRVSPYSISLGTPISIKTPVLSSGY